MANKKVCSFCKVPSKKVVYSSTFSWNVKYPDGRPGLTSATYILASCEKCLSYVCESQIEHIEAKQLKEIYDKFNSGEEVYKNERTF